MIRSVLNRAVSAGRTLCKPLANRLEKEAASHPTFRRLINTGAQANDRLTTQLQRRIYCHSTHGEIPTPNGEKAGEIPPPKEDKVAEVFAELIADLFFVTAVGAALILKWRSEERELETRREVIEANGELSRECELLKLKHQLELKRRGLGETLNLKPIQAAANDRAKP